MIKTALWLITIDMIVEDQSKNAYDYLRFVQVVRDVVNDLGIAIMLLNSHLLPMVHNEIDTTYC